MKITPREQDVNYIPIELPKIVIRKSKLLSEVVVEEFEAEVRGYSSQENLDTMKKLIEISQEKPNALSAGGQRKEERLQNTPPQPPYVT